MKDENCKIMHLLEKTPTNRDVVNWLIVNCDTPIYAIFITNVNDGLKNGN